MLEFFCVRVGHFSASTRILTITLGSKKNSSPSVFHTHTFSVSLLCRTNVSSWDQSAASPRCLLLLAILKQHARRHKDVFKELCRHVDALGCTLVHNPAHDLAFEWSKHHHAKFHCHDQISSVFNAQSQPPVMHSPLTLTLPFPFPINPSDALSRSYIHMHSPTLGIT